MNILKYIPAYYILSILSIYIIAFDRNEEHATIDLVRIILVSRKNNVFTIMIKIRARFDINLLKNQRFTKLPNDMLAI